MPDDLVLPTWLLWVAAGGTLATAMLAIVALAIKTGRGMRTIGHWIGTIVAREVTEIAVPIIKELVPNGGSSLRDQVDMTNRLLTEHIMESIKDRRLIHEKMDELDRRVLGDHDSPDPEAD